MFYGGGAIRMWGHHKQLDCKNWTLAFNYNCGLNLVASNGSPIMLTIIVQLEWWFYTSIDNLPAPSITFPHDRTSTWWTTGSYLSTNYQRLPVRNPEGVWSSKQKWMATEGKKWIDSNRSFIRQPGLEWREVYANLNEYLYAFPFLHVHLFDCR